MLFSTSILDAGDLNSRFRLELENIIICIDVLLHMTVPVPRDC